METEIYRGFQPDGGQVESQYSNINIEEVVMKAVASAVSETIKALIPFMSKSKEQTTFNDAPANHIKKKYKHITPSKISTLTPEIKKCVDDMIISGEYSCQQIANFIMNNHDMYISQMAVNRYKRMNFVIKDSQLSFDLEI